MTSDKAYALEGRLNALVTSSMQNLRAASTLINSTSAIPVTNMTCSMPAGNWRVHGVMYWTQNSAAVTQNWSMGGVTWTGNVQMTTFAANSSPSVPVTPTLGTTSASYMVLPAMTNGATVYATEIDGSIQVSAGGTMQVYGAEGTGGDTWTITGMFLDVWPTAIGPLIASQQPYPVGWLNVLSYGADALGIADSTIAINKALTAAGVAGGGMVYCPHGTYLFSAPLHVPTNVYLAGDAVFATSLVMSSGFAGTIGATGISAGISLDGGYHNGVFDLALYGQSSTITSNANANGIEILSEGATLRNLWVEQINGWGVELVNKTSLGASTVNSGLFAENVTGSTCAGGIHINGNSYVDTGCTLIACGIDAGITSGPNANLDCFLIEETADDCGLYRCGANLNAGTGSIYHVRGRNTALLASNCDIGINSGVGDCVLIENDGGGNYSYQIVFTGCTFTGGTRSVVITGAAFNIRFIGCHFWNNKADGVQVASTGSGIDFIGCDFGTEPGQANGQGATGTNYDLNWSGTASGCIDSCTFGSPIVLTGSSGVQASIGFGGAGRSVIVRDPRFYGSGTAAGNQVTGGLPAVLEAPLLCGTVALVAGTVTVSTVKAASTTWIRLQTVAPGGTPGALFISAVVVGTSFTIKSTSATDTSTVAWTLMSGG